MGKTQLGGEYLKLVAYDPEGQALVTAMTTVDGASLDSFSRLRVSGTGLRFESVFTYDAQPDLFDETNSGAGSVTHDTDLRAVYLSTGGTATGAKAGLRQKYYTPYTPGSSQLIAITGNLNPDGVGYTNARAEIGYGDTANGVGFRYDENGAHVFIRSSVSGTAADLVTVAQADWDNPVATVDWTKSQIFLVDFQSLAVGRVRFYMDRGGQLVLVHEIHNDNLRTGPYWQIASLPVYWSVENTGAATETARVLSICSTVKSEGGLDLEDIPGIPFSVSRSAAVSVSTTALPVLSIQVQPTFNSLPNRMLVFPDHVEGFASDQPAEFHVILNGTISGGSFQAVNARSGVYYDVAGTAITGGRRVATFYVPAGNRGGVAAGNIAGRVPLAVSGSGGTVGDILSVVALRAASVNASVKASLDWKEIR